MCLWEDVALVLIAKLLLLLLFLISARLPLHLKLLLRRVLRITELLGLDWLRRLGNCVAHLSITAGSPCGIAAAS